MFLWVYLTLKEHKSCFSVTQVQSVLANLPKGLDGIYRSILRRLRDELPIASFNLCYKALTCVASAVVCSMPIYNHQICSNNRPAPTKD